MLCDASSCVCVCAAPPAQVRASVPYYNAYKGLPDYFDSHLFEWAGDETHFDPSQPVIDIITAPNNPDGAMRGKSVQGVLPPELEPGPIGSVQHLSSSLCNHSS